MTVTSTPGAGAQQGEDLVTLTIDGVVVSVPKGTLVIRAAEMIGTQIPRFCDHPLLDPVGACRQCLVEVAGQRKPLASCTTTVSEGMVVKTQLTSPVAEKAQYGVMELLLINHPLDCPVCDKGGECPLQNQAMSNGRAESRFEGVKRTYPKPIAISSQVLLDRERCILCARCTRFSDQIAGDPFIDMVERGALQQVGIYEKEPFDSYFSGNTVQICPVGALTGAAYRFRSRPFDLVSTPSICEHCASGCAIRTDHRRGKVLRRMAGDDPAVNEEWNCDKGRWAFQYATMPERITTPLVRDEESGELVPTSWPDALAVAAAGLRAARDGAGVGVLPGGRVTLEDGYAWSKFARLALGTNDVDFRARPHSAEEAAFLGHAIVGTSPATGGVTYADLEHAPAVLLVGFEPEEESPMVFLRLRKGMRKKSVPVFSVAPYATRGLHKMGGRLLPTAPGTEPEVLAAITAADEAVAAVAEAVRRPGAIVLVGERAASVAGTLSAVLALVAETGARLAWVPRRAGDRGALEAGLLPGLLPGGRPVDDAPARVDVGTVWGVSVPAQPGRDATTMLTAARDGALGGLVVGGVDPDDLPDPVLALEALDRVPFLVSLEQRVSAVTSRADVVLPVAPVVEKSGTFLDWEGRERVFGTVLSTSAMPDLRVLSVLADELDAPIGVRDVAEARRELAELAAWDGARVPAPSVEAGPPPEPGPGQAVLATWAQLLDLGTLQAGEPFLAGTAHASAVRLSAATAAEIGAADGDKVTVATAAGELTLPLTITAMPDRVVWVPTNSVGSQVRPTLAVDTGAVVTITAGSAA
ncbi:MAG TPA: NADH-quinone oxidoreductase subunit G [Actinomycetes bacterium]|nr:NADH-quinone oxidoreductase subunit G [Actinomycetes bacterium]